MLKKIALSLILLSLSLIADNKNSLELNVNNEDFEIKGDININRELNLASSSTQYYIGVNYLGLDKGFYPGDKVSVAGIGLYAQNSYINAYHNVRYGQYGTDNLLLALGIKALYGNTEDDNFFAVPLFGMLKYRLYLLDLPNATINAEAYYAPNPLAFNDLENYFEMKAYAEMEVIENVSIVGGYRVLDVEYKDIDTSRNDAFFGGLKIFF